LVLLDNHEYVFETNHRSRSGCCEHLRNRSPLPRAG
jgi:hypothetical protein